MARARRYEILAAFDRIDHPPRGVAGGKDGAAGQLVTSTGRKLKGKGFQTLAGDERLVVRTPGGGGLGAPAERDPALIEQDRLNGLIEAAAA